MNKKDLLIVLCDKKYLNSFSSTDLRVRNVESINDYIESNIKASVSSFTLKEKLRLLRLILYVDWRVYSFVEKTRYFDPKKFSKIPWKFGVVDGKKYEEGLSHTRNGVIILSHETLKRSSDASLCKTLLHEKVHVYQYLYPKDVQIYITHKGLKPSKRRSNKQRANPDTNDIIYVDNSGIEYSANYKSNAKSILDVSYSDGISESQFYEHPYESMSIELEKLLFNE